MESGGPVTGTLTVRLEKKTINHIRVAAALQGIPPGTLVRQVVSGIFDNAPEDLALALQLQQRIEQLQPAQQAETI